MFCVAKSILKPTSLLSKSPRLARHVSTQSVSQSKAEGDISAVFPSLSGLVMEPLPERFTDIKRQLIHGNEERVTESWQRLLKQLASENEIVKQRGPDIIPQIEFEELANAPSDFIREVKKRGVAVIKGVVPESEARAYKSEVEEYVKRNPSTKGMFRTRNLAVG
tara:strand:- start:1106 stop:1600 length:495 start_codon:yes stop_codon:yes gene_type:complete